MRDGLDRPAAACLFPAFDGITAPDWVLRWLERGLGGLVLFAGNIESREQVAELTRALRAERDELLVATDEEGGDVTRLEVRTGSSFPGNWALGVIDDPSLTEEVAAAIASELAAVGINWSLAPVADVNANPENPVIGIRAFGADASLVSRHVSAFAAGVQRRCVAACAKHFPGHGDTAQDSHLELPLARGDVDQALEPFRAAIGVGVRSIMTAHVRVTRLAEAPATLSREILHGLLRDELGFQGVAITDALEMRAISATVGVEEGAVRALAAGADGLCLGARGDDKTVSRIHSAVLEGVRAGRLPEERLHEAAGRVAELARWASRATPGSTDPELGLDAARRALEIDGDVALRRRAVVIELRPAASIAAGEPQNSLAAVLGADEIRLTEPPADAPGLLAGRGAVQPVVVVRDAHRHQWEQATVDALLAAAPETIVVEVGVPLWRPDAAYLATHGRGRVNLAAAAEQLLSRIQADECPA
jgi:beta-N-acetylhexosaminidase